MAYFTTTDGTRLFYQDWGQGRPVVLVHCWAAHSGIWDYQLDFLARQGLRCIAPDRRGHGRSEQSCKGYDFDTLADDLAALLDHLGLRGATLVAHSMGAGEAVRYLSRHGTARVSRLLLLAPTTPCLRRTADNPDGFEPELFEALRAAVRSDRARWLAENMAPFFVAETSPQMMDWVVRMTLDSSLPTWIETNRINTEADFRPEMARLELPTLIVHGDRDVSAPLELTGRKSQALIRGSELRIYEGAPHGLLLTHKERLNRDLLEFCTA